VVRLRTVSFTLCSSKLGSIARAAFIASFAGLLSGFAPVSAVAADSRSLANAPEAASTPQPAVNPSERRARVVLTVDDTRITVGELEDYLAAIPTFQLSVFGSTPSSIARGYLESVVLRELLLAKGAKKKNLDTALPTSHLVARALSSATLRHTSGVYASPAAVPEADVARYFDEHRANFETPERILLWRILCKTREEALGVLAAARRDPTPQGFMDLAREHSLDKATYLRGGNLGFVAPDGTSNEAGVRVDPRLVSEAKAVKDGDFVPSPVPEADAFAVVWRRGTVAARSESMQNAQESIRTTLYRQSKETAEAKRIAELRVALVKDVNAALVSTFELPPLDAGLGPVRNLPRR